MAGFGGSGVSSRRTRSVHNFVRAGVPDLVAMKLSGHRTRSIFDRYNISGDEQDMNDAAAKISAYHQARKLSAR
jgi:pheromone shutdown protein TraB